MTETSSQPRRAKPRPAKRSREDKYDERRTQLAESALATLGERGYARTSLREIAQNSEFSHGVVHYYFASKADLILHCVRYYKIDCATRYDEIIATATDPEEFANRFVERLLGTLRQDASMHRLWYDLRGQSMFDQEFADQVEEIDRLLEDMIWRIVTKFAELSGLQPAFSPALSYAMFDGVFFKALLAHVHGDELAPDRLREEAFALLPSLFRDA
ncbi:TetR family transcriptional regulator [Nocardioides sp. Soil797]|nr:TetR family transcriptional regulator [Nocardioides sp. Soil797]